MTEVVRDEDSMRLGLAGQGEDIMSARDIRNSLEKLKADSGRVYSAVSDLLTKLDAMPLLPDVYEQIRERYSKPFEELRGPFRSYFGGWFIPLMEDGKPVFQCAAPDFGMKEYLTESGKVGCGYFNEPRLILRPAKRIAWIEDPNGTHIETATGGMALSNVVAPRHCIRYRREGTP